MARRLAAGRCFSWW